MVSFESYERRINKVNSVLKEYGIQSLEAAKTLCDEYQSIRTASSKSVQPIAFENAGWAYIVSAAIALKKTTMADKAAEAIRHRLAEFLYSVQLRKTEKLA